MSQHAYTPTFAVLGLLLAAASPAVAQPASCKPVFDALDKVMSIPTHIYTKVPNRVEDLEAIYAGGKIYQKGKGDWELVKVTTTAAQAQERETRQKASYTCKLVKEDLLDGVPVNYYETKAVSLSQGNTQTIDTQAWVSRDKNLLLKQEIEVDAGKGGHVHYSIRYEYDNVQAPKL